MKKLLYIAVAFAAVLSCKDPIDPPIPPEPEPPVTEDKKLAEKIVGEWHCTFSDMDADIYVSFADGSAFELYQKVGEGSYRLYRGTWNIDEEASVLNGKYNDGTEWGSSYTIAMSEDEKSMTMSPKKASEPEEHVYRREDIPSEVKERSIVVVKSMTSGEPVL